MKVNGSHLFVIIKDIHLFVWENIFLPIYLKVSGWLLVIHEKETNLTKWDNNTNTYTWQCICTLIYLLTYIFVILKVWFFMS